jgi:hypothetical protein
MTIVPTAKALAQLAGRLRAATVSHGLTLGDCFCIATRLRDGLSAWTSDHPRRAAADVVNTKVVAVGSEAEAEAEAEGRSGHYAIPRNCSRMFRRLRDLREADHQP